MTKVKIILENDDEIDVHWDGWDRISYHSKGHSAYKLETGCVHIHGQIHLYDNPANFRTCRYVGRDKNNDIVLTAKVKRVVTTTDLEYGS